MALHAEEEMFVVYSFHVGVAGLRSARTMRTGLADNCVQFQSSHYSYDLGCPTDTIVWGLQSLGGTDREAGAELHTKKNTPKELQQQNFFPRLPIFPERFLRRNAPRF